MNNIAILCTDGVLKLHEIKSECVGEAWVPVVALQEKNKENPTIPLFGTQDTAIKFAKRNLDKGWLKGCIILTEIDIQWIKDQKWGIMELSFPRKLNSHPDFTLGFEVIELNEKPDFFITRGRPR